MATISVLRQYDCLRIPLTDIESATNNFAKDNQIGGGGFGPVYKGTLISRGNRRVAVKVLDHASGQGDFEFWKEVMTLSEYKHKNIISLLGFSDEKGQKILVYEYASRTSLDKHLKNEELTWARRLNVCIGAARGLAYLHNPAGTQQRLLHLDIKSSNILLDGDWNALISDFGQSKFGPANKKNTFRFTKTVVGTIGYVDPEYYSRGLVTKESDVYSFGVVLLEVLCGRLCIVEGDKYLRQLVKSCIKNNTLNEIIWYNIKDEIHPESLKAFSKIAVQCVEKYHEKRPKMEEIVRELEICHKLQMTLALGDNAGKQLQQAAKNILFGKYESGKLVGAGAFSKVYHCWDIESKTSVAIKVINKQKIIDQDLTGHVMREISAMRQLRHPNIVRLHEVLANQKKIYFVLEFAKGGDIFSKVTKSRFNEHVSRRYFQQLISAVGYCHSRGVYHRDLKPENLLLDEDSNIKVTDFGVSAVNDQVQSDGLLHTMCGTPAYSAPEILARKGYDGAKVDIWSCGIILYVFNAGYLPFNDPNLIGMYRKIFKGEFQVPRWTSPELKRFLSRLLDTNPETRITVDEIIKDPWFRIGYKDHSFSSDHLEMKDGDDVDRNVNLKSLNAFEIISSSSGFNLSGLFGD